MKAMELKKVKAMGGGPLLRLILPLQLLPLPPQLHQLLWFPIPPHRPLPPRLPLPLQLHSPATPSPQCIRSPTSL